jgi:hypothetical protein
MRGIFLKAFLVATLIRHSLEQCLEGCLRCAIGENKCLFCDTPQNWVLRNGRCEKVIIQNCKVLSTNGACSECDKGYYPHDGLCVFSFAPFENCEVMKNATDCKYCASDFYLVNSTCTKVENIIDNCLYYSDEGVCARCNAQSFLFIDQRYCVPVTDPPNCVSFTQIQCSQCKSGYFFNQNMFIDYLFKNTTSASITTSFLQAVQDENIRFQTDVCQKGEVAKCLVYSGPKKCFKCETGYTLIENQCFNVTLPKGTDCLEFDDNGKCVKCVDRFYVGINGCAPVMVVPNCGYYNSTASFSECTECIDGFYLNEGICLARSKSLIIQNCINVHTTADICAKCTDGYNLTSDGLSCLPQIPNCKFYYPSSSTSASLQCEYCNDKMYYDLKQKQCVKGTVENCQVYQSFTNRCSMCTEGYYLSRMGSCLQHLFAGKRICAKWSQSVPNLCDECPANHFRLYNINSCNPITTTIDKCSTYATSSTCGKCIAGYVVSVDKKSCVNSSVAFCVRESATNVCEECGYVWDQTFETMVPYILSADKSSCNVPDLTSFHNCRKLDTTGGNLRCKGCKNLYYPAFLGFKRQFCLVKTNYKLKRPLVVTRLLDCEVMDLDKNECIKCVPGKYVSNGACVNNCPTNQAIFRQEIIKDYAQNSIYISRKNYCDVPAVANCLRVETSVNSRGLSYGGTIIQGCVECATGYKGIVNIGHSDWGLAHIYTTDTNKQSPTNRFAFIHECVETSIASANLISVSASIANCKFLQKVGSIYGCISCEFGYTGKVVWAGNGYFIESCTAIADCNTNSWFAGLGGLPGQLKDSGIQKFPLDFYVSCHKCFDSSKVVAFERSIGHTRTITNTASLAGLSIWGPAANPPFTATPSENQNICIAIDTSWSMPERCAMIMIIPDMIVQGYINKIPNALTSVFCVACEPGYRATVDLNGWVLTCTLIENCIETQFNGCKKCKDGMAHGFDPATGLLDFGYCYDTTRSPNCLHGYANIYGIFVCVICKEGFVLNRDYLCDPIEIKGCLSTSIFTEYPANVQSSSTREPHAILIWYEPNSCRLCQNDQLVAEGSRGNYCVKDSFQTSYGFTSSNYFARNCAESFYDGSTVSILCNECMPGSNSVSQKCYPNATPGQITGLGNCTVYDSYNKACTRCSDFNYLDTGICYEGFLPYCFEYESWEKCQKCQSGYIMIAMKTGNTICIAQSSHLKCIEFDTGASLYGELSCLNCTVGYYATSALNDKPAYTCVEASAVKNCELHDTNINYMTTSLECLRCKENYYLKYNYCFNRTTVQNCAEYNPNDNLCVKCVKGYSLANNGLACNIKMIIMMPVPNCLELFDLKTCMRCATNYYLVGKICAEVPIDYKVKNCLYYSSSLECDKCSPGFFIKDGKCTIAKAKNCLEYESEKKCLTCPTLHGLKLEGGLLNCVSYDIDKCVTYDLSKSYPFECLVCEADYYVHYKTKHCTPVKYKVDSCAQYQDESTCERCQPDTAISPDGKYCYASPDIISHVDENCQESYLSNEPLCNACAPGYLFNNGVCIACKLNMITSGCMYCDPDDHEICLFCASGFYMNNAGICIKIRTPPTSTGGGVPRGLTLVVVIIGVLIS